MILHFSQSRTTGTPDRLQDSTAAQGPRLNLLLTSADRERETFDDQLPRLLAPMGIHCMRAESGDQAADVIRESPVHIAVIDWTIPMCIEPGHSPASEAGERILQLLRRIQPSPPMVVVRPPQPVVRSSVRSLNAALREGAFAVLDRPIKLETLLEVLRRVLHRHYRDTWPT